MTRYKDGEYINLDWNGTPGYEIVRGHVDRDTFIEATRSWLGDRAFEDLDQEELQHTYGRFVPDGEYCDLVFMECDKPGRGAFPVTIVRI